MQHVLSEMQTLESGLTPHARCVFPHTVHTLGITNWMQCLVCRKVSSQIDSEACRYFARTVTPTCCLSMCRDSFASSAPPYLHRCSWGSFHANTVQTPFLRNTWSWETRRISLSEPRCQGRGFLFQRKTSIIMHWLRGRCPRPTRGMEWAGRKMYWLQHWENFQTFIPCQHNECVPLNNVWLHAQSL